MKDDIPSILTLNISKENMKIGDHVEVTFDGKHIITFIVTDDEFSLIEDITLKETLALVRVKNGH